jgi:hypothetical protein
MTRRWPSDDAARAAWLTMPVLSLVAPEAAGSAPALSTLPPLRLEDSGQVVEVRRCRHYDSPDAFGRTKPPKSSGFTIGF